MLAFAEAQLREISDDFSGLRVEISAIPTSVFHACKSAEKISASLHQFRLQVVIRLVPKGEKFQGFYSNLFTVPKPDGSVRPILDLKGLNKFLCVKHFRMESVQTVAAVLQSGEFLASIDLKDAYLHVPIFLHQKFLRFFIEDQHYQPVALLFGLTTAP